MTNAKGNTWTKTYNSLNQVVEETDPAGYTTTYTYDPTGNLLTKTTPNGNIITYTYDADDRLIKVHYPDSSEVQFSYDANGNRISMTDKHGTTSYSYDALNRLVEVTDTFGNTVQYSYDKVGNQIKITYPDVKEVDYSYDDLNRLQTVTDWLGHQTTYSYDSVGNVISMQYPNVSNTNYAYDSAERLIGLENKKSDNSPIASYSYTLDAMGNHIDVDRQEPLTSSFQSKDIAHTYDADNRILSSNSVTYTHDADGNLLSSSNGENYTWDYEDRLIQVNGKNYLYNGLGQRIGAGNTRFVLDVTGTMTQVLAETDSSGNILSYYVHGLGLISKIQPNGDTYYYYGDSRGSTIAMLDDSESLVNAYSYSPFGEIVNYVESVNNDFTYVGRHGVMRDGYVIGLYFMRARYYDAEAGRFLSKDPVEGKVIYPISLHSYIYTQNNPVILIDPRGLCGENSRPQNLNDWMESVIERMQKENLITIITTHRSWIKTTKYDYPHCDAALGYHDYNCFTGKTYSLDYEVIKEDLYYLWEHLTIGYLEMQLSLPFLTLEETQNLFYVLRKGPKINVPVALMLY